MKKTNTAKTETVKIETIETVVDLAIVSGMKVATIQSAIDFINQDENAMAWDIVERWIDCGRVFAAIKKIVSRNEFNAAVDKFFGTKVNKNNRSAAMQMAELDYHDFSEWYLKTGETKTSPTTVIAAWKKHLKAKESDADAGKSDGQNDGETGNDGQGKAGKKSEFQKVESLLESLTKKLENETFTAEEMAIISSRLLALGNASLACGSQEEEKEENAA